MDEKDTHIHVATTTVGERRGGIFLQKISFLALLAVSILTPIFFLPLTFIGVQFSTSLLFAFGVIVSVLLYIVSMLISGRIEVPKRKQYFLPFLLVVPLVYLLAGISNGFLRMPFFGYTFDIGTVGFVILSFAYLFLVSFLFRDKKSIFYSYFAFLVSSLIFSLYLLSRLIFGAKFLSFGIFTDITSTPIGSWNNVGVFFGLEVILCFLTYYMLKLSWFMKILLSIAIIFSLFFLILVNFNIIWVVLVISSFIFCLYSVFRLRSDGTRTKSWKQKFQSVPTYPLLVFIISLFFIFGGTGFSEHIASYFKINSIEVRPDFSATVEIAKNTLALKPLFGSGPNTFGVEWLKWKPNDITTTVFWNTDFANGVGLIPTFAITTGLLGLLSWILFFCFYIYVGVKSIFAEMQDIFLRYLVTSSFFVSLYLWIIAFIYVPSTPIFILTFFFTGLFFASLHISGTLETRMHIFSNTPRSSFIYSIVMVVICILGVGLGYGLIKNSQSLWYFQKSSHALNTNKDVIGAENYMIQAISAVPHDIYLRALSEIRLYELGMVLSQDPNKVRIENVQSQFSTVLEGAIKAGIAATEANPDNYLNWVALGRVYEEVSVPQLKVEGAIQRAEIAYEEAARHNPKNPSIPMLFARLYVTAGDLVKAKNYVLQAIGLKKDYLDAYFLLSQIEVASKNIKGAIDSVTAASIIDPTNPAIFFQLGLLKYNASDWRGSIVAFDRAIDLVPDYANAKYFLGLSYDAIGEGDKALEQFTQIKASNPDNAEVVTIISNLQAGRRALSNAPEPKPEKGKTLPIKQKI